mmetsp:Transcript_10306/g.13633  ORF Transcript_10306/g.13633 Transcript_10306/m.13633 type:complete len:437 (+) Transcript_10306:243-1553(+)
MNNNNNNHEQAAVDSSANSNLNNNAVGRLEELKQQEALLAAQLAQVRREKLATLQNCPLRIGIVGFGRFGQFIAKAFRKHGHAVIVTSRSNYTPEAQSIGAIFVDNLHDFFNQHEQHLDVIVFCVSILSFKQQVQKIVPFMKADLTKRSGQRGPLVVDVLSVKEHPRKVLLELLPPQVDLLLTHPMFGPDSGKNGWHNLNFVYEKTRIDGVILDQKHEKQQQKELQQPHATVASGGTTAAATGASNGHRPRHYHHMEHFVNDTTGHFHSVHENSEAHVEAVDRMERFLSIWEEEGCNMVQMSCREHDAHAANSQFITHLMGRILGQQGLVQTPIDTSGFESVLKLVDSTTADSFDLFYGLYKFNNNSFDTIQNLKGAMDDVVTRLKEMEEQEEQQQLQLQQLQQSKQQHQQPPQSNTSRQQWNKQQLAQLKQATKS